MILNIRFSDGEVVAQFDSKEPIRDAGRPNPSMDTFQPGLPHREVRVREAKEYEAVLERGFHAVADQLAADPDAQVWIELADGRKLAVSLAQ